MSESAPYILNTVQTPGPLETVYRSIRHGNTTESEIKVDTGLGESLCKQGLDGLNALGLAGRQEPDYYTVDLPWTSGDPGLDFRMAVLHNLAVEARPTDWGKQSVVLLNYQYLLQNEIQAFETDDSALFKKMDHWEKDEKGYIPRSQQGEIDLNGPKFTNWARLADFLGLIYKANGRTHTVYPDEAMIDRSIRLAVEEVGGNSLVTIEDYIEWLQENLLLVELTSDRNVPSSLSRVLFNLVKQGRIEIVESGDVGAVGLNGVPRREGIDKKANSIEVIQ